MVILVLEEWPDTALPEWAGLEVVQTVLVMVDLALQDQQVRQELQVVPEIIMQVALGIQDLRAGRDNTERMVMQAHLDQMGMELIRDLPEVPLLLTGQVNAVAVVMQVQLGQMVMGQILVDPVVPLLLTGQANAVVPGEAGELLRQQIIVA